MHITAESVSERIWKKNRLRFDELIVLFSFTHGVDMNSVTDPCLPVTTTSIVPMKSRMETFWYWLTRVHLEIWKERKTGLTTTQLIVETAVLTTSRLSM